MLEELLLLERPMLDDELLPFEEVLLELVPLLFEREFEPLLTLLFVPVLPELDELPLLGRFTLPELLLPVPVLPELDELPLLGRFTLLELLVPELFGRLDAPLPFRLLVVPALFGRLVAPLFEPLLTRAPLLLFSSRELMLPGVLLGLLGRTVACELPLGIGVYPSP